jgi:hypothetical protein
MTPEIEWMAGTFTGFADESVWATRYQARPANAMQSRIRMITTKTWTLVAPGVDLRCDGARGGGSGLAGRRVAKALITRL